MQVTPRTDLQGNVIRLAIAAAVIAFLLPLLPLYGGGHQFIWTAEPLVRPVITFFLYEWMSLAVVATGILFLRRDRLGSAGGFFASGALVLAVMVVVQVMNTAPHFGSWGIDVFMALEIIEGVLLALAGARAIGARST